MLHADGGFRWVRWRGRICRDADGRALTLGGSMTDVSEARALREATLREALYDSLTGLPNRALLSERLGRAVSRANRPGAPGFALLIVDVDRFRVFNDGLGHAAGDRLLDGIGQRLQASLRPADSVARLGGDEFAVLVEEVQDVSDVERVVRRITQALRVPFQLETAEVVASVSIGIAYGLGGSPDAAEVLRAADSALHRAKASGRGRHAVFEPSMHWRAMTSLRLENDLRRALDRQELRLAYQPIVSLRDGALAGFEALLRWRHPERGALPPSEFVRIAEESGLILPLGEWVLREACRHGRSWRDRFGEAPRISVNVSGRQLAQPGLVESVSAILAETGMDERHLGLEITESAMIDNAVAAQDNLSRLRALSIRISVDDFGTGHSCLSRLHTFPVDALKVDRSFIARMDARRGARETVRAIVALARDLQLEVVAEGIETVGQREALESLDCGFGQGFLFAHAVDAAEAEAMIEGGQRFG
jgi:diguanylate cyclase (GGDEF)-like protein